VAEYASEPENSWRGPVNLANTSLEQIPAKLHDPGSSPGQAIADKDLLQCIDLARFLFGKVISFCREARWEKLEWAP